MFKGAEYITALTSFQAHGAAVTNSLARSPRGPGSNGCPVADRPIVIEFLTQTNQFDQNGLVPRAGVEPTLANYLLHTGYKSAVLPLNYRGVWSGCRESNPDLKIRSLLYYPLYDSQKLERIARLELATFCLASKHSTN